MSTFNVRVYVGNMAGGDMRPVEAVVDTGCSDSMFPASLLAELHIEPDDEAECFYANEESEWRDTGLATIQIGERNRPCPVIFGPENQYLLGSTTLEIFHLAVDPVAEKLAPAPGLRVGWGGQISMV